MRLIVFKSLLIAIIGFLLVAAEADAVAGKEGGNFTY
jgi:hypothetical protein